MWKLKAGTFRSTKHACYSLTFIMKPWFIKFFISLSLLIDGIDDVVDGIRICAVLPNSKVHREDSKHFCHHFELKTISCF